MTRTIMALAALLLLAGACSGNDPSARDRSTEEPRQTAVGTDIAAPAEPRSPEPYEPGESPDAPGPRRRLARETIRQEGPVGGTLADFPRDVPLLPGASLADAGAQDARRAHALLTTSLSPSEVFDFYEGALSAEGWSLQQTTRKPGQQILTASKDDRRVLMTAVDLEGETRVSLAVQSGTTTSSGRGGRRSDDDAAADDDRRGRGRGRGGR